MVPNIAVLLSLIKNSHTHTRVCERKIPISLYIYTPRLDKNQTGPSPRAVGCYCLLLLLLSNCKIP